MKKFAVIDMESEGGDAINLTWQQAVELAGGDPDNLPGALAIVTMKEYRREQTKASYGDGSMRITSDMLEQFPQMRDMFPDQA